MYAGNGNPLVIQPLSALRKVLYGKMSQKQESTTVRTGISISRELLDRTDEAMKKTGARSRSDFIAEALDFYIIVFRLDRLDFSLELECAHPLLQH